MAEVEKLKQLQMQRETLKKREEEKVKETEKKHHEESVLSVCPEWVQAQILELHDGLEG